MKVFSRYNQARVCEVRGRGESDGEAGAHQAGRDPAPRHGDAAERHQQDLQVDQGFIYCDY